MSFSFPCQGHLYKFHTEVGGDKTTRPVLEEVDPAPQEQPIEPGEEQG